MAKKKTKTCAGCGTDLTKKPHGNNQFGYCLSCLPDEYKCIVVNSKGVKCKVPKHEDYGDICKNHGKTFGYGQGYPPCSTRKTDGKPCTLPGKHGGKCLFHKLPNKKRVKRMLYRDSKGKRRKPHTTHKPGDVYIFNLGSGFYKIGLSISGYKQRLESFRAGNPLAKVFVVFRSDNAAILEAKLHNVARRYHYEREIFQLDDAGKDAVVKAAIADGAEVIAF